MKKFGEVFVDAKEFCVRFRVADSLSLQIREVKRDL